jgi:peptidyl-prolyl cis-trans isomerase D
MITAIRRLFSSKVGALLALAFVCLMGLAFAVTDVNSFSSGGSGVSGGNVARVGDRQISSSELQQWIDRAYDQQRQQNPGLTREQFVASGAIDRILDGLIDSYAVEQYARQNGMGIDKSVIDAFIVNNPQFANPLTNNFDQQAFEAALQNRGMTEVELRQTLETQFIARQLLNSFGLVTGTPRNLVQPYASLRLETREGQATFIPAALFRPTAAPTDAQLLAHYRSQRVRYTQPERRAVRYAILDESAVRNVPPVTDAEIAADFRANAAQFAARESRTVSQVIASTRPVADRIAAAVRGGQSLTAAAQAAGLAAGNVTPRDQAAYASATNAAVARSVFAADEGALIGPQQVPLGFIIVRVQGVERRPATTLAEATPAIRTRLLERKRQDAISDIYNEIQDRLNDGVSVAEIAEQRGLPVRTTPPLLPNGMAPGDPSFRPDALLPAVLPPAFELHEGDPAQIITLQENRIFALVEVAELIEAAPPPLRQIRDRVAADWQLAEGARQARTRARAIRRAVEGGTAFAAAARAQGAGEGVQALSGRRIQIEQARGNIPPEIVLLFSMAPGTAKTLEMPNNAGWMVITLNRIIPGDIEGQDQLIDGTRQGLSQALPADYQRALVNAARRAVRAEIDAEAVDALRRTLSGAASSPNS